MDNSDEVQSEQMEDYCRQLGLQLRDEQETPTMLVEEDSQTSVLGTTQPSVEGTNKAHFECKKCEKNFTNSRQFLKHKCVLKSVVETPSKTKGKKRGRTPKAKVSEKAERVSTEEVNEYCALAPPPPPSLRNQQEFLSKKGF